MSNRSHETFHDPIVTAAEEAGLPERFFDRFVFNLHPVDRAEPSVLVGHGLHPRRDTVDGFAIAVTGTEQRNLRWSGELSATDRESCGPFRFAVLEQNRAWRIELGDNPSGVSFDLTWTARTPHWWGDIDVVNAGGETTRFSHLFQSGLCSGRVRIGEDEHVVDGWYSQRDRSRGVRTMSGGQGLHIWYQAQFPDRSVGFLLVESRDGSRLLLEGAVMHTSGDLDPITEVRHDLTFDDLDLRSGTVLVETVSGARYTIAADASARGGLMSGGGYGGHHGERHGREHVEHDVYPLDGSISQRTLDSSLTDRSTRFDWNGTPGAGIFEFALTRSPAYRYRPTL
ncbi:hypothetical protein [Pseudonocardia sp. KRD291]|uniref:DUF7064 domain-containing protein n=1 Tax=Pseudonocardia sp. KRD291 TaxID=2792007 RepID=UPI001C4A72F3|nr:hypothetical protein [Pseudonocardia sp. KRD291]MBW0105756.1 hypothetical protein [Pseudonocardia sp. KRD291]